MALGLENIKGVSDITSSINLSSILSGVSQVILAIMIFVLIGGMVLFFLWRRGKKKDYNKHIFWFEEVNGNIIATDEDLAMEMTIPGTAVRVLYIKKKDMFLPKLTKKMGKNSYWLCVTNNKEIVNFTMKNLNVELLEAGLLHDHSDMRYQYENLRELIKRNYRDKSVPWWKEYKDTIVMIVYIFVFTLAFFFLISKIGGLIDKVGELIDKVEPLIKAAKTNPGSGVITQ